MNEENKSHSTPDEQAVQKNVPGMSRREFTRCAALTALVPAAICTSSNLAAPLATPRIPAEISTAGQAASSASAAAQTPSNPNLPKLSAQSQAEVDARIQSILGQYGERFSDEQKTDIRRLSAFAQPPLDRLRAYHLDKGDAAALYLKPLYEREKPAAVPASSNKKP